jgi:type III secretion protein D
VETKYRYKIKLLSSALAGRQILLPDGKFQIGGDDPDLAVALEGGHSAVLSVSESGVALATDARCWIDGLAIKEISAVLPSGTVVDIGGLGLVLGLAEDSLDQTTMPVRREMITSNLRRAGAAWAALMLTVSIGAGGVMWGYAKMHADYAEADPDAWMTQWQIDAHSVGVQFSRNADGLIELTGSCHASAERNKLVRQLRNRDIIFRDTTQCRDELLRNVQAVLKMHGFDDARVTAGESVGEVLITGRILSDARWRSAVATLATMRGLHQWSVQDVAAAQIRTLIDMLKGANLVGRLSVARENSLILITGIIDEGAQRSLTSVLEAFAQRFSDAPKVVFQNIHTSSLQAGIFTSPVVSFGGQGELAFLDLANGTRVKAGSRLPSGYTIINIDRNGIEFERDGEVMHLPLEL